MSNSEKPSTQTKINQREEQAADMIQKLGDFVNAEVQSMFVFIYYYIMG
mgnify:CR=1 FL=1